MLVAKRRITSRFGEPTRAPARKVIEARKEVPPLPQWKTVLELQKEGVLTHTVDSDMVTLPDVA